MIIYKLKQNIKSKEEKNFEGGIQMINKIAESLEALYIYIFVQFIQSGILYSKLQLSSQIGWKLPTRRARLLRNKGLLLVCQKLNNTQGVFTLCSNYIKRQTI